MDNILGQEEEDKMLAQAERDPYLRYDQGPAPTQQQLRESALELQQMHSRNDFQVLFNNGSQELEEKMPDGQTSRPTPQQSEEYMQRAAYFGRLQQQQLHLQLYQAQQARQAQQHQPQYSHQLLSRQQPVVQAYDNNGYLERMNSAMISAGVPVHMPQAKEHNAMSLQHTSSDIN